MSLASVFAKTIVKASDNVFDAQKVSTQIKAPVARINEAVPFTSNDQVEYAQKVVRSLITGESPKFSNKEKGLDPDGAIYNSLDEMLVGQLPELRYARYYKVADKKVELEEADQAVVEYYRDIISAKKEARLLSETAIQTAAENVVKNIKALPEYKRFVTARMPKKVDAKDDPITSITNRDVAEQEFLRDSLETDYVYRATDLGADREYDLRFPFPAEISTHVGGDMGQANFIAIQKIFGDDARDIVLADAKFVTGADADGFPIKKRVVPEKSLNKFFAMRQEFTRRGWSPTELDLDKETFDDIARTLQLNEVEEMAMLRSATSFNNVVLNKGRVNIQNPLDLKDQGWTPDEFNADPELWIKAIANQTGFTEKELLRDPAYLDLKSEIKESSNYVQGLINGNTINFLTDSLEGLRSAQLSLKIKDWLESYGFDSIRYINSFEPSVPEGSGYSYVLFQPEQFKSATAVRFDPTDPRFTAAEGGVIGFLKKFLDSNQEIQETARRTVREGDTLAKISKDTGVSVEELQRFNNLKDPNKIQAGQSLRVREPIEKNQVMSNLVSYLNPFTGDKTAEDYDSKVVDELRKAAKNAIRAGRMNIEYEDYRGANVRRQASSPEQRTKDSFIRRMALGPDEGVRQKRAKGGKVDKKKMACNKPKTHTQPP
jgi:LysM repeat protein